MREDLENKLYETYESILVDKCEHSGKVTKCHLDIGSGWYDLVATICNGILTHEDSIKAWNEILKKRGEPEKEFHPVKAVQIKEKFGGLRFYVSGGDEFIRGVIFTAEAMSRKICENCGERGKTSNEGWMVTLCDKHHEERRWRKQNESQTTVLSNS